MPRNTYDVDNLVEVHAKADDVSRKNIIELPIERDYKQFIAKNPRFFFVGPEDGDYDQFELIFGSLGARGMRDGFRLMGHGNTLRNKFKILRIRLRYTFGIMLAKFRVIKDIHPYLHQLENNTFSSQPHSESYLTSYPNNLLWNELLEYAFEKHGITQFGFTEIPEEFIFKEQGILFRYALVFYQEMKKDKIDKAPDLDAGAEVQRIYNKLGKSSVDISRWLRSKGMRVQADHPLGGKVNFPPLAVKSGLGAMGHNGLLITPDFGQRVRITVIYVENKLFKFTDTPVHRWVIDYCGMCNKCVKKCPMGAIYKQPIPSHGNVKGFGQMKTTIDVDKCTPFFLKTLGCSVCVQVCPFSKGDDMYDRLHKVWQKRNDQVQNHELLQLNVLN